MGEKHIPLMRQIMRKRVFKSDRVLEKLLVKYKSASNGNTAKEFLKTVNCTIEYPFRVK